MAKTIRCIGLALLLIVSSVQVFAQATASSSLRGTVVDGSGAAVMGADVTVSNTSTGFTRTVKTTNDGSYVVEPLPVGVYSIKVTMQGFAATTAGKVETLIG
jgi:hypothetical protein